MFETILYTMLWDKIMEKKSNAFQEILGLFWFRIFKKIYVCMANIQHKFQLVAHLERF